MRSDGFFRALLRLVFFATSCSSCAIAISAGGYSSPIHVLAPGSGGRCINSTSDEVTVALRRVIIQKTAGIFSDDKKAGVAVISKLNANAGAPSKTPSVTQVDISDEHAGQVSLALEYPVASQLRLKQQSLTTQNLQLNVYLARTRGKNGFGKVLEIASEELQKLPIPQNPYSTAANQFLGFANKTIQDEISSSGGGLQFASLTMQFADHDEYLDTCLAEGYLTTGALAVLRSGGPKETKWLPVTNLDRSYCFRYSTRATYELLYAPKAASDCKGVSDSAWNEVPNDYVMLLVAAARAPAATESEGQFKSSAGLDQLVPTRFNDLAESKKLCEQMQAAPVLCGVE